MRWLLLVAEYLKEKWAILKQVLNADAADAARPLAELCLTSGAAGVVPLYGYARLQQQLRLLSLFWSRSTRGCCHDKT
jgi:hypothetical protein